MELALPINQGAVEVYAGCMKSGKTLELIVRLTKIKHMTGVEYIAFKPDVDTRDRNIFSRFGNVSVDCVVIPADDPMKALDYITEDHAVVALDEAQFFNSKILRLIDRLESQNKNVLICGLDTDFKGETFGSMGDIMARALYVHKFTSICDYKMPQGNGGFKSCPRPAERTQRLINGSPAPYDSPLVLIGDRDIQGAPEQSYEARCKSHHYVPGKPRD
jgi:thymidine kinase